MKFQIPKSDNRAICRLLAALAIFALSFFALRSVFAVEPIDTPEPAINSEVQNAPQSVDQFNAAPQFDESQTYEIAPNGQLRVFPAVLERRFGPVEQCEPEFYTLKNSDEPGFAWNPPGFGFGGWGGWWPFRFSWPGFGAWGGFGSSLAAPFPRSGFGLVGYNRYYSRPWYASPSPQVWSSKFPWYSPGGVGPNIYQPWYQSRNALPWYSPLGVGPNIYTPNYLWQSNYPWYSPNGPGPNIYTPSWQYDGCFYW